MVSGRRSGSIPPSPTIMKDPCQGCLIKGCCTEICDARIMFSVEFYQKQNGKISPEVKRIWEENWKIIKQQPVDEGVDWYGDFLECMLASINLLEGNEKNK